jgi:hypothetical protein
MSPPEIDGAERVRRIVAEAEDVRLEVSACPWPVIDAAAYHGLTGDVVRAIELHTEADPVAILIQTLAAAGSVIGAGPYFQVEGDRHGTKLFAVLVGDTAKGRKGTSWGRVRQIMEIVDPDWARERVHSGLSTGEGVIWAVHDPITQWERQGRGQDAERVEVQTDPGVTDKRLYIIEPEFAGSLTVMRRDGNTLSRVIRDAWDRGDLATLTKHSPARATGAHISIVGHITAEELRQSLDRISISNGFGNRFLWLMVRRARVLPFGGALDEQTIYDLGTRIRGAIERAQRVSELTMTAAAREAWERVYPVLSAGQAGLLGAILARAEAQTIRLALLYALLDGRTEIDTMHLCAAIAVWEYCEASARYIWREALGNPITDEILRALRDAGEAGLNRTQIRDLFGRHRSADQIAGALATLAKHAKARLVARSDTGGRPAELWVATSASV